MLDLLYQELALASLHLSRWHRKFCVFIRFSKKKKKSSVYLFDFIHARNTNCPLRNSDNIPCFNTKHNFFNNSFFPSTIIE